MTACAWSWALGRPAPTPSALSAAATRFTTHSTRPCPTLSGPHVQHEISKRNLEILENETDAMGRRLKVIKLHAPAPMFRTFKEANTVHPDHVKKGYVPRTAGERLAGSYINHLICNGAVICPQFGGAQSKTDAMAVETLQKAYPNRKVRPAGSTSPRYHALPAKQGADNGGARASPAVSTAPFGTPS